MKFIKRTLFILIIGIIIVGSIFILNGKKMYEDAISKTSLKIPYRQYKIAKIMLN